MDVRTVHSRAGIKLERSKIHIRNMQIFHNANVEVPVYLTMYIENNITCT